MAAWTTNEGERSKYFNTSIPSLVERVKVFARVNGMEDDAAEAAYQAVVGPGGPFELVEDYIRTDDGTTGAPHLKGPEGKGQKFRHFKNGPHLLRDLYSSTCQANADKEFICYKGVGADAGPERYTYAQALDVAMGLAAYLAEELGVKKGDRIAQISRNYPEWILSFMASTAMGCIAMPTNSLWVPEELEYGMNDSGTVVAFVDGERAERLLPLCRAGKVPTLQAVIVNRDPANFAAQGGGKVRVLRLDEVWAASRGRKMPSVDLSPEDNALIMYTSGTTGNPKGVVSTHRQVLSALRGGFFNGAVASQMRAMTKRDTKKPSASAKPRLQEASLCAVPLFHATGLHAITLQSFFIGRKVVLMHKWDVLEAMKLIESERVTHFTAVPTMSMELLGHPDFNKYDLSSLSQMIGGGAPPPKRMSADVAKTGKRAGQGWGLTESNAITVTTWSPSEYVNNPGSCGRAHILFDIKVVDENNMELPPGSSGEVLLRGPGVFKEYWRKEKATAEAISVDGWFRTGDIGKLDADGALYILDRAKDLIIRGGENISCAEVESAIYEYPSVQECAVFGMPDERLGEVVGAAVVCKPGSKPFSGPELEVFLIEKLAKFKVPSLMYLWREGEQLPRGATGKIPKRTIRDLIKKSEAPCVQILPPPSRI